ncbi:uncharacterized protein TM35_000221600 [Trypanosoma theileri]|uniref:Uncharacterized protein n=1 Tax=Trypanosoma theileri TaxID=67003 RepID=A0A1X0NRY7_9TRYP|nr:uncharacterized protein TM35_000221600 [Trypanosoma theileri]ORC87361.1 hypothetical protein TM35_000221600 [Trypanosoma theileri]
MTEVRRVTTTPVDWGSLDAGMVLAVATGRNRRCSVSECRVLLFSSSGAVLAETKLTSEMRYVVDAAVNSAGVVAVVANSNNNNSSSSSSNSGKSTLAFVCGPQLLSVCELPSGVTGNHAVICLRLGSRDVAVCAGGTTGTLLGCTQCNVQSDVWTLWEFGDACVTGVVRGKQPNDALVLLDDGSVALVALRESDDGSLRCVLQHSLQVSEEAVPIQAVFAAGSMLWVLCDDYSLCGYWFPPPMDEAETIPVRLFSEQLSLPTDAEDNVKVFMTGENRTCGVHIAIQTPTAVYFCAFALHSTDGLYEAPTPMGWSNSILIWSGHIHSFSVKQCAYELLVQSELGGSPLSVMSLQQNASVLKFEESQNRLLSHQVVCAAPEKLAGLREKCELKVQELEVMTSKVMDLKTIEQALSQLLILQDCLVATLHRERELNKDLQSYQSVSMHLIKRLHITYIRLSVYQLLYAAEVDDKLDIPLRSVLNLEEARQSAVNYQAELRSQFEQEFELMPVSSLETLSLWGSQDAAPAMCIDAILSYIGCTDQISLRTIVQQMTMIKPETAILVLYCTFMSPKYDNTSFQNENVSHVEFLNSFCLPFSLGIWARLAFMADHHIVDPAQVGTTHVLGCPPLLEIIPGIINGLTFSGAYELVFQLTPSLLTLWTVKNTDSSVAVKLLFLAYKRGCSSILIALYRRSRGTIWAGVATLALAWAARQTENIQLLSGLVVPDSPEESIVESVLRRCPDTCKSELLLMDFYILMQRYADALKMCEQIVSHHSVEAQRVQVIASHLRSLLPNGNDSYRLRYTLESEEPVSSTVNGSHPRRTAMPNCCPLQNEEEELEEAVARTTAHICARRHDERSLDALGGSHQREVSVMAFTPTPAASLGITRDKVRGALQGDTTGVYGGQQEEEQHQQQQKQQSLMRQTESSASVRRTDMSEEISDAHSRTLPPRSIGATAVAAAISLDGEPLYCEAILKRSKKPCGRKRPCEYHDRVRK